MPLCMLCHLVHHLLFLFVHRIITFLLFLCFLYSRFIISRCFPFLKCDRSGRTPRQTIAKPVTKILPDQLCFAIYDVNGSFMTSTCA